MGESGASELKSMMKDVTSYGTARKSFENVKNSSSLKSFEHGGKTGSVDRDDIDGRVEWFVGFLKDSSKIDEDIACAVFTVHGAQWTVHSSYIAAEMMRKSIGYTQKRKKEEEKRLEEIRIARDKFLKDSTQSYLDSVKLVQDSIKVVQDSISAVQDSLKVVEKQNNSENTSTEKDKS